MSLTTPLDIPVTIIVPSSSPNKPNSAPSILTTRRLTPTWTVAHLSTKLEPITGIPPSSQSLTITSPPSIPHPIPLSPASALLSDPSFSLTASSTITVTDLRPPALRGNFTDTSLVDKYEMPAAEYAARDDSVLAWKRRQGLGRFDPNAKSRGEVVAERRAGDQGVVRGRGIVVGRRCRLGGEGEGARRGTVRFVGEIDGLGGQREEGCWWVGVELDEPLGRNDGSVLVTVTVAATGADPDEGDEEGEGGDGEAQKQQQQQQQHQQQQQVKKRLFDCRDKFGVFARPEKVEVGDFPPLDDLELDEDLEEI